MATAAKKKGGRKRSKTPDAERYADHLRASSQRNREIYAAGRDIAPLPDVVDQPRRDACERDFRLFCETYLKSVFYWPWSDDHLKAIAKIEAATLEGGLFAYAMPRGSGKTAMCEAACVWATLYGHRRFVVIIGAEAESANERLESIKTELDSNEELFEDFPGACYPIRRLEGSAHRCPGQTLDGKHTHISISQKELMLPTVDGSASSGAIVRATGLTGRLRGMVHKRQDGQMVRPDLVVIDDPQSDESAASISQNETRERLIAGAVLGMAGPGKKIAAVMPCTVIRPDDMVDRVLDREKHPEWQGERVKMVYDFPKNTKLWDQYAEMRRTELQNDGDGSKATEFYKENRKAMDEGSRVAWEARFDEDELSAIQNAMNLKIRDERAFFAEYQNEPMRSEDATSPMISMEEIVQKINRIPRGNVPVNGEHLTAFIDVQQNMLFYTVCGWAGDFTGWVVDYGTWPEQKVSYFVARDAHQTLGRKYPKAGMEGAIYAGLKDLCDSIIGREWKRDDGPTMRISKCFIDANWGASTNLVYDFCRQSVHAALLMPSHGRYYGASSVPISEYRRKQGEKIGHYWTMPSAKGKRLIRYIMYDTNYWKTFITQRLAAPMGDPGCLSLFGKSQASHKLFAEHLTAEYSVRTEGRGRVVDEWKQRKDRPDNHWFDCLVGCAVAASMFGISTAGMKVTREKPARKRLRLSDMQARRS